MIEHALTYGPPIVFAIIVFLALMTFLRAFSVKAVTGKWPHQDERSRQLFQRLP